METTQIIFYGLCAVITASALLILFTKNIIHAVYLLALVFLGIGGIFVVAHAEFVAVTQIIIYAGGVLILLVFGIMITNRSGGGKLISGSSNIIIAAILGICLFFLIVKGILEVPFADQKLFLFPQNNVITSTQGLGITLMSDYVLAFEVTGILLLIALVGAAFLAKKKSGWKEDDTR